MYFVQTYQLTEEGQNNYSEFLEWYTRDRADFILAMESVQSIHAASNLVGEPGWDIEEW